MFIIKKLIMRIADIVTFDLTSPFPVGITVQEKDAADVGLTTADSAAPDEVIMPAVYGRDTFTTLIWINPSNVDFEEIFYYQKG